MSSSLKQQTISGMLWSAVQKFGNMGISFVSNIILARMLTPDDYGCIGMLAIFITVSSTFVDGGFGSALIQKKEPTQKDYSTIFWWNLFISFLLYGVLFMSAPVIGDFYHMPLLPSVLRVQGIILIINSLNIIQTNQLRKQLRFKRLANVTITAHAIAAIAAIILAWKGWGVWSLVAQQIISSVSISIILWNINKWTPDICFSKESFKQLFGFGGFVLLSNLINTFCDNIQGLLIGRFFNPFTLGLYTQARKLEDLATSSISGVVNQVAYPVLSHNQSNKNELINTLKKFICFISFIVFPLMFLLILIAEPLIILLYSIKWIDCVPYFRILCIAGLAISLQMINYNAIAAIGKSKILFKWTIIKRSIGLFLNIGGILLYGIYGLLIGGVITAFTLYFINAYLVSIHVGYKIKEQLRDLFPTISITLSAFFFTHIFQRLISFHIYIDFLLICIVYLIFYFVLSKLFNCIIFSSIINVMNQLFNKKRV